GGVLAWWFNGYDEDLGAYSPGVLLIMEIAKAGAATGVSVIDFGRGEQRYKLSLANEHRALCEGSAAAAGSLAWWLRAGQKPLLRAAQRPPKGRVEDLARRALVRLITPVRLPEEPRRAAS
ncbi:MAG: GNAT family N-acetyltransferase, partial [Parvularculaceae bacterium]|nr:GNAT family N-acetyltransferase [Parvularculaceae bacterium]